MYDILKREEYRMRYKLTEEKRKDRVCNRSQPTFSALRVSGSSPFGWSARGHDVEQERQLPLPLRYHSLFLLPTKLGD
jgi:hypothetical protein